MYSFGEDTTVNCTKKCMQFHYIKMYVIDSSKAIHNMLQQCKAVFVANAKKIDTVSVNLEGYK
jgi:hypothetical protein